MIQLSNNKIRLNSPGKVNLHLAVGEKRNDGFHNLNSIFAALDFADTLHISVLPGNDGQTTVTMQEAGPFLELFEKGQVFPPLPAEKNMVYLASVLFRAKTGLKSNLSITLTKNIPPGSGLGGGSSNAAATLLALNELFGTAEKMLSADEMLEIAAQLGSDVPFFVEIALSGAQKSPARLVSGRGEIMDFLPEPPHWGLLLAFPGFASHTGAAFSLLDKSRPPFVQQAGEKLFPAKDFSWNFSGIQGFSNDFEKIFLQFGLDKEKEAYRIILAGIKNAGAFYTALSGSGSCCFGIFSTQDEAIRAEKQLGGAFYALKSTFFLRDI